MPSINVVIGIGVEKRQLCGSLRARYLRVAERAQVLVTVRLAVRLTVRLVVVVTVSMRTAMRVFVLRTK